MSWTLKPLIELTSKYTIPAERKAYVMNYYGAMYPILSGLGLLNSAVGMTMLLDKKGRVRWKAVGQASPNELQYLTDNIQILLHEK